MYTDFEQDLILACKNWYGEKGIEKVIRNYIGYSEDQQITIDSIYHFISELYIKIIENKHLKLYGLLQNRLSLGKIYDLNNMNSFNSSKYNIYDFPRIICDHMIAEIREIRVQDDDKILIKLHDPKEIFKDKIEEVNKE